MISTDPDARELGNRSLNGSDRSGGFSERPSGDTRVLALGAVAAPALRAEIFMRVANRRSAGLAHCDRGLMAEGSMVAFDFYKRHFAPAL